MILCDGNYGLGAYGMYLVHSRPREPERSNNFYIYFFATRVKPGLHFERKSTEYTQTILRTWGTFSRPPMPIYAVGIAQVPSVNTPTIRRLLGMDAGLSLANSSRPLPIRRLLRGI